MIRYFISKEFFVFLATGGFAALINFGSRFVYNQWMDFSSAVLLAYLTGMITAFILAKLFVFKTSDRPISHSALIFTLVNLVALVQTWGISVGLSSIILPSFAHAIGIMVPVFTSYLGHKFWTFKAAA
jgi:putative flippase GtrA